METKQVMIIALLVIAVVLSTASVMMNVSFLNKIDIRSSSPSPETVTISFNVIKNPANSPSTNTGGFS